MDFGHFSDKSFDNTKNFKQVIEKYASHYKWFIFSVLFFGIVTFITVQTLTPKFYIGASILIKEIEEGKSISDLSSFEDLGLFGSEDRTLENEIQILNVAGPRLSHHPWIYKDVKTILEVVLYLLFLETRQDAVIKAYIPIEPVKEDFPQTVEEAINLLCDDLPLKTKTFIAKCDRHTIHMLYFTLLEYFRRRVGFDAQNTGLLKDCSDRIGDDNSTIEDAVMEILKQLKQHLETDHILRVVK